MQIVNKVNQVKMCDLVSNNKLFITTKFKYIALYTD